MDVPLPCGGFSNAHFQKDNAQRNGVPEAEKGSNFRGKSPTKKAVYLS
jgi:hypothetical protein